MGFCASSKIGTQQAKHSVFGRSVFLRGAVLMCCSAAWFYQDVETNVVAWVHNILAITSNSV